MHDQHDTPAVATVCYDGGGWTIPYLIGATRYLQQQQQQQQQHAKNRTLAYTGVSSGACVALAAALGVPMDDLMDEVVTWARACRQCPWLTVTAVRSICRGHIGGDLPTERSLGLLRGRFAVGVSRPVRLAGRLVGLEPRVLSEFGKHGDGLLDAMAATCTVPYVNTLPSLVPPIDCLDGVLTGRFFEPPWDTDAAVRISASADRREAAVACPEQLSLFDSLVPMSEARLAALFELGAAEGGPRLDAALTAGLLEARRPRKKDGRRVKDDRRACFDERVHVGGRRDVRVSAGGDSQGDGQGPCEARTLLRRQLPGRGCGVRGRRGLCVRQRQVTTHKAVASMRCG